MKMNNFFKKGGSWMFQLILNEINAITEKSFSKEPIKVKVKNQMGNFDDKIFDQDFAAVCLYKDIALDRETNLYFIREK